MSELVEITENVVAITSGWSGGNVGGIALDNFSVAVDTTHNFEKGTQFRNSLETHFGLPVKYTFLTHHHSDHANGLNAFRDTKIVSSKKTGQKVRSLTKLDTYPTEITTNEYTREGGDIHVELVHTGGHTSDSSYLYFPKDEVIFAGDLLFENYLFFAGYQSDPCFWINVLEHFKTLKPRRIIPGHGPILKNTSDLDKHISLLYSFMEVIKTALNNGIDPRTLETPDFVFAASDRIPEEELTKWFKRTVRSWHRKVPP